MTIDKSLPNARDSVSPGHAIREDDTAAVADALTQLIRAARTRSRDPKLVSALLRAMAEFLQEQGADAAISTSTNTSATSDSADQAKDGTIGRNTGMSMSPALRARVQAVIASLSDDEAARNLGIGTRQVRRRAVAGSLYFFRVGRRRRFPCWQFVGERLVLPGLRSVGPAVPRYWPPEVVHAFMTTAHPILQGPGGSTSPVQWLVSGGEPAVVASVLSSVRGEEG